MLLISLGTRSGLWAALAGAGPLTARQRSREGDRRPGAGPGVAARPGGRRVPGLRPGEHDTFTLPDAVAAAILDGPGGPLVEACVAMLASMVEGFADFSAAFAAGEGFGWHQRTAEHWHGTDALHPGRRVPTELIGAAIDAAARAWPRRSTPAARCSTSAAATARRRWAIAGLYPAARRAGRRLPRRLDHARPARRPPTRVDNVRFEVASATELPDDHGGYDLITFFDSLHDIGDPRGALVRARAALAPTGAVLLFEPLGADRVADNLNPSGRMFYAISTLACTPNAVSQRTATSSEPLGAQAGEPTLRALAAEAGFATVRRLDVPAPMNLVSNCGPDAVAHWSNGRHDRMDSRLVGRAHARGALARCPRRRRGPAPGSWCWSAARRASASPRCWPG